MTFVRAQVEKEVSARMISLDDALLSGRAQRLLDAYTPEITAARRLLTDNLAGQIDDVMAEIRSSKPVAPVAGAAQESGRFSALVRMKDKLQNVIREKYVSVTQKLLREFRIFTGVNAGIFILFSLLLGLRRKKTSALLVPAMLLLPTAAVSGVCYLFAQNWLYTLLFNDYAGFAYLGWNVVVILFLLDIALNDARVCEGIVETVSAAVGAVLN